jgi:hypothetical protein
MLLLDALPAVKAGDDLTATAAATRLNRILPWDGAAEDKRLQPVIWLLHVAPGVTSNAVTAADVLQQLLHLPNVPLQHARQLVEAGVRISYAQLLSAASDMVAAVEVWVQAQQDMGLSTDVPVAAVAVCCQHSWVSLHRAVCCWLPLLNLCKSFCYSGKASCIRKCNKAVLWSRCQLHAYRT